MTDFLDRAAEYENLTRQHALEVQKKRANLTGKTIDDSAEECADCGDAIPQERRQAVPGCRFCVDCQSRLEMKVQR